MDRESSSDALGFEKIKSASFYCRLDESVYALSHSEGKPPDAKDGVGGMGGMKHQDLGKKN